MNQSVEKFVAKLSLRSFFDSVCIRDDQLEFQIHLSIDSYEYSCPSSHCALYFLEARSQIAIPLPYSLIFGRFVSSESSTLHVKISQYLH